MEEKCHGKLNKQISSVELKKKNCTYINMCKCVSETSTVMCFQRQ